MSPRLNNAGNTSVQAFFPFRADECTPIFYGKNHLDVDLRKNVGHDLGGQLGLGQGKLIHEIQRLGLSKAGGGRADRCLIFQDLPTYRLSLCRQAEEVYSRRRLLQGRLQFDGL